MADKVLRLLVFKSAVLEAVPIEIKDESIRSNRSQAREYLEQKNIPVEWAFLCVGDWVEKPGRAGNEST